MIYKFYEGSNYPPVTINIVDYNSVDKSNYDLTDWSGTYHLIPNFGSAVSGSIDISGSAAVSITIPKTLPVEFYGFYMEFNSGSHTLIRPDSIYGQSYFIEILTTEF